MESEEKEVSSFFDYLEKPLKSTIALSEALKEVYGEEDEE
jgi:hypothetical protein